MTPADLATWLLTYAVHSTVLLGAAWLLTRHPRLGLPAPADALWKAALVGGILTASVHQAVGPMPWHSPADGRDRASEAAGGWVDAGGAGNARIVTAVEGGAAAATLHEHDPQVADVELAVGADAVESAAGGSDVSVVGDPEPAQAVRGTGESDVAPAAPLGSVAGAARAALGTLAAVATALLPWALAAWVVFALVALVRLGVARVRLARWLAPRQTVRDRELVDTAAQLARAAGMKRTVRLTWSADLASPVALGTREVCLPSAAFDELDAGQMRSVLAHEIAHLARRDPLWLAFALLLERIFFFQPLNRLARIRMQDAAEFLCDEWAARESGSGITLATSLARVAEWLGPAPVRPLPLTGMAESRSQLLRRVHRLMDADVAAPAVGAFWPRTAATALVLATAVAVPGVGLADAAGLGAGDAAAEAPGATEAAESGWLHWRIPGLGAAGDGEALATARPVNEAEIAAAPDASRDAAGSDGATDEGTASDGTDAGAVATAAALRAADQPSAANDTARERIVRALVEALDDADAEVRTAAAHALGDLEDPRAIPGLAAALQDDAPSVRHAAVHALGHMEDTAVVMPLIGVLGDASPETRAEAAKSLGDLEDRRATMPLLPLLRDANAEVRAAAAEALGDIADPRSADALAGALRDEDPEVREAAADALGDLELTEAPAPLLEAMRDPIADVQLSAIDAVGDIGDARAVPVLRQLLQRDDAELQKHAVEALGEIRTQDALEALVAAMRSPHPTVRRHAASALGRD